MFWHILWSLKEIVSYGWKENEIDFFTTIIFCTDPITDNIDFRQNFWQHKYIHPDANQLFAAYKSQRDMPIITNMWMIRHESCMFLVISVIFLILQEAGTHHLLVTEEAVFDFKVGFIIRRNYCTVRKNIYKTIESLWGMASLLPVRSFSMVHFIKSGN